jgi:tRNA(fMet)-specific endonuclease VapC
LSILLDSSACIAGINGRPPAVIERLGRALADQRSIHIPSIALFELWYGVAKSRQVSRNTELLRTFLIPLQIVGFDDEDSKMAGEIRATLERAGTPIGPYDTLIAAQAVRRNFLLITANVREFSRVEGLRWENWAK